MNANETRRLIEHLTYFSCDEAHHRYARGIIQHAYPEEYAAGYFETALDAFACNAGRHHWAEKRHAAEVSDWLED